ncbi:MotA/TolQ/ExbB proton channel family protein [Vibrio sp. MA40-2]|uniref:MotA/TolQ/ExbB proton channel family protein n=1 Tax=Vibrio sp. MA40-2 TaxID=3391828 RepID=UPI0039A531FB
MMSFLQDNWTIATGLPLLLCSIFTLALIIERLSYVLSRKMLSSKEYADLTHFLYAGMLEDARAVLQQVNPFYIVAYYELIKHKDKTKALRDEAVTLAVNHSSRLLRRRLTPIVTIGALAPMLGLLGTIIGLMRSFHDIGLRDGPVEPAVVADGLWQALTTTAAGMVIAVICVFFNAFLRSKIRHYVSEVSDELSRISLHFEDQNQNRG